MLKLTTGFRYFLSILLITAGLGFSQTGTGNIQGVVKDATGAVVPNAKVTIVHTATGGQNSTQTNDAGFYFFPSIQVGEYQISVESAGMDSWKGTLNLLATADFDSLDPTRTYYAYSWDFQRYFTRTLMGFDSKPGAAGTKAVEVARLRLPTLNEV